MKRGNLVIYAGERALGLVRDGGLKPDMISVMAGAAGGPKWLALFGFDRALVSWMPKKRKEPLFLLGSSIGAWRFAAYSHKNPVNAMERFRDTYMSQRYIGKPTATEVSAETERIMNEYITPSGIEEILSHPYFRINILAVKCSNLLANDSTIPLSLGLGAVYVSNMISRKNLKYFFKRTLFHDSRNAAPFHGMDQFPIQRVGLDKNNLKLALMASGAIPLVMKGIAGIPGAEKGLYRDGGLIDYHLDVPFLNDENRIVLYPHYTNKVIPGWFDKALRYRKPDPENFKNVLFIAPSKEFLERLPYGKIPDRNDFSNFYGRDSERISYWDSVVSMSEALGDEFVDMAVSGKIKKAVMPFKWK